MSARILPFPASRIRRLIHSAPRTVDHRLVAAKLGVPFIENGFDDAVLYALIYPPAPDAAARQSDKA